MPNIGKVVAKAILGTEEQAQKVADAIEKMLDTTPNSIERDKAKKELIQALLRK
ncbi:hypothetical protein [Pectinatus frisingensis]|uniref:hypothetical protein n=1 Tax=Pectinatus frisingensis TaxID=865 RepID=UPI0018C51BA0|nr:hypothetical protein [Pectinatus frisingensis]